MYTLELKEGQTAHVTLKNEWRLTFIGGKPYKQSLLKQLHEEKIPFVSFKEEEKPTKKVNG